jgi:hypothetical protein
MKNKIIFPEYVQNNINFRIVSSHTISKFKEAQAFDFNEINTAEYKDKFSKATREIVLIEYDYWFKFILEVERYFLQYGEEKNLTSCCSVKIKPILDQVFTYIEDILISHDELFSNSLISYVIKIHEIAKQPLAEMLNELEGLSIFIAFPMVTKIISAYLQMVMFSMFEFNHNVINSKMEKEKILCFTDLVDFDSKYEKIYAITERACLMKQMFGVREFTIKNYKHVDAPHIEAVFKQLEEKGIRILNLSDIQAYHLLAA